MSARQRTARDRRRRQLGQNFLRADLADRVIAEAQIEPGELVLDFGAGLSALTLACARRGAQVLAIEIDPLWAERLRARIDREDFRGARVVRADFLRMPMPSTAFRVVGCVPFGLTTAVLRRLLDDPLLPLVRADLIVQAEVARKRARRRRRRCYRRRGRHGGSSERDRLFRHTCFDR
ncbi:MAG: methyltransferase domain-containing protein [Candidatus Dormibacteraeota bacterium]|nr:methyltransferase domain-containing protein [Candidatus Dormibacteraeota bacterium]